MADARAARAADAAAAALVWSSAVLVTGVFAWVLFDLVRLGAGQIDWAFLTGEPEDFGRGGGIGTILVSTGLILGVCMAVAAPLGLGTAVLLAEFTPDGSLLGLLVRRSLDVLAGVPSIVFGLFGNAFFCVYLGMGFSILSGGLTSACMVLPILIRSTEEGFRSVPDEYRMGAAALGMSRAAALRHILLPAASPGLVVGLTLGIGRALAETAALIFTSGYVARMPESLFDSGRALSLHIYDLSMNVSGGDPRACATALVLVALLLAINGSASWMAERWLHRKVSEA
ncbi:MAG: phosphate ABC transporter permease PstA [Planctomycetota bacterium]|nr:phosphate ABC transporter permease PstA [Planctomycetota bacterium]